MIPIRYSTKNSLKRIVRSRCGSYAWKSFNERFIRAPHSSMAADLEREILMVPSNVSRDLYDPTNNPKP